MTFRDDREASHRRAEALQQEVETLQRQVAALKTPTSAPASTPARAQDSSVALPLVGAALAVFVIACGVLLATGTPRSRRRANAVSASQRAQHAEVERLAARTREEQPSAPAPPPAPPVAAVEPVRTGRIAWPATVDAAEGVRARPGDACVLDGDFAVHNNDVTVHSLTVRCGDETLYRFDDDPAHPPPAAVGLREGPVYGAATHVYLLRYDDAAGVSPTRPTLNISTLRHTVTLSRAGATAMSASLYVRDVSDAREGPALDITRQARAPAFAEVVARAGRVLRAQGAAPARAGERCSFEVRPVWEYEESCRVALRCGGRMVYGSGEAGYLACALRAGRPVGALDERTTSEGGDPRLTWRDDRVTVSDFGEAGAWSLDVGL